MLKCLIGTYILRKRCNMVDISKGIKGSDLLSPSLFVAHALSLTCVMKAPGLRNCVFK